jgi:hypothetical protein
MIRPELNLPSTDLRVTIKDDKELIFDSLRRKYVALTPEEWVRQNFVSFLINHKGYLAGLMNNEVSLVQNGIKRRCDTLVSDKYGNPIVIVEYKAPNIEITQKVFDQIVRYNYVFRAKYLIVSNGLNHYCCCINYDEGSYSFLKEIPSYADL